MVKTDCLILGLAIYLLLLLLFAFNTKPRDWDEYAEQQANEDLHLLPAAMYR
jgi:hypothetical protein